MTSSSTMTTGRDEAWAAYNALRVCRRELGIAPGAMHSLQAILSFLPQQGSPIIHAANRTIAERAACSDRTLRRHIGDLEKEGLLKRVSSSNGKRYRLSNPDGDDLVFGIDISPLVARLEELTARAQIERDTQDRLKLLRQRIYAIIARREELDLGIDDAREAEIRKILRRKETPAALQLLVDELQIPFDEAMNLSASDGQNDRHIQTLQKEDLMKERAVENESTSAAEPRTEPGNCHEALTLGEVIEKCPDAMAFAPAPIRSSDDLRAYGWSLGSMAGISERMMHQAAAARGLDAVVVAILGIVQRGSAIRNAPAYFRTLFFGPRSASFDPMALIRTASTATVSRANDQFPSLSCHA